QRHHSIFLQIEPAFMVLAVIAQRLRHFDVVLFHQITHEIAMALWNAVSDGADCDIAFALGRYILWNQNIDPVPFAVAMFIKPFQLAFELMRTESGGAEHAEPAGSAYCCDNVAAMAERH